MDVSYFIGGRLRFKGQMAMISIAVSFLVMIVAVSVSYGFRHEIRDGLADISGDIQQFMDAFDSGNGFAL